MYKNTLMKKIMSNAHKMRSLKKNSESGSAMIFAIVLTIVTMSIVSLVVAVAMTSLQKTADVTRLTYYEMGAQSAMANALSVANSPNGTALLAAATPSNPVTGKLSAAYSDQGIKWSWSATRVNAAKYYINAIGYRESSDEKLARTLRVTITPLTNVTGAYSTGTGKISYTARGDSTSQWGVMGSSSVTLNDGVKFKSYLSSNTLNPSVSTNQSKVASNGNISLGGTSLEVDSLNILNYSSGSSARCTTTAAKCAATTQVNTTYGTTLTDIGKKVRAECPAVAQTYPVWIASENSGVIAPGCYNTVVFDVDTKVNAFYTDTNPAKIYVKGNVIVGSGVNVNTGKDPLAFRLYSEGGSSVTLNQGTATNPTRFYGVVFTSTAKCTDATTSSNPLTNTNLLYIYGNLVCDDVNLGAGTNVWWDELAGEITEDGYVTRIWFATSVEEIY
jgi:hypothetical protein